MSKNLYGAICGDVIPGKLLSENIELRKRLEVAKEALCAIENATDSHAVLRSDEVNRLAIETLKAIKEKEVK